MILGGKKIVKGEGGKKMPAHALERKMLKSGLIGRTLVDLTEKTLETRGSTGKKFSTSVALVFASARALFLTMN
jgi:hypothetical protein